MITGSDAGRFHQRLDEVLGHEDGLVVLADGSGFTTYGRGFGVSGCQIEGLLVEFERLFRGLAGAGAPGAEPAADRPRVDGSRAEQELA